MLIGAGSTAYRVAKDPGIRILMSDLACCALEVGSAVTQNLLEVEKATHIGPRITVVLISGTVTELLAPALEQQWSRVPGPKIAVAVGACASSGGPYWDAPTVMNGITGLIPASGFIAGCPPRPDVIVDGVCSLVESL
jgi:NADH-quinone oxidoreductase subunit B